MIPAPNDAAVNEPGHWPWVPITFVALRHRNFRLYWIGQVVSLVGSWMQRTAQGWLVTDLVLRFAHGSQIEPLTDWWVAVVSASAMLPGQAWRWAAASSRSFRISSLK